MNHHMNQLSRSGKRQAKARNLNLNLNLVTCGVWCAFSILSSCSPHGSSNPADQATPPVNAPLAPIQTLDMNVNELAPNGCLDLSLVNSKLKNLPAGALIREYTTSFDMEQKSIDGKALPRLRNMAAETAFSNFIFEERSATLYSASLPSIAQTDCASVDITDEQGSTAHFEIVASDDKGTLHIKSGDGLEEHTFVIKNTREMEITHIIPRVDRCPDFLKARGKVVNTRIWGMQSDLDGIQPHVRTDLLKRISIAVTQMPAGLSQLIENASSEIVDAAPADLRSLRSALLDPRIVRCPFDATPPSADEPPPPEEGSPVPSPTPAPTPTLREYRSQLSSEGSRIPYTFSFR